MATLTIQRSTQRSLAIKEWLNEKSDFYSQIMEEPVSRVQVLRVHLIFMCILLGAGAVETSFFVSFLFITFAGKLVYDLNTKENVL